MLGRRVSASGRTAAFVAGRAASAADLKLLGGRLLAFYGQHEHRKLTISSAQMEVLDGFAGAEHLGLREDYREAHRECARLEAELAELRERDGSRERDLDLYRYELAEIEEVAPDPAEEAELSAERERLRHAEGLREAALRRPGRAPPAPTRTAAARRAPWPRPNRCCTASPASTPSSTRWPSGSAALAVELGDVAGGAARLPRRDRGRPRPPRRGRGAPRGDRPPAAQARRQRRVGARPRRALPGRDRAAGGRRDPRRRGRGRAGRGRGAAREARQEAEQGPRDRRRAVAGAGRRGAGAAGDAGRPARGRAGAAPRRLRPERARDGRAADLAQPGMAPAPLRDAASGRRALAGDAGAERARRGRRRGHARLRRDRRRGRRQDRPRRRRAPARARRGAPGPLHHPPAAGRLAGPDPLPAREGPERRAGRRHRASASTARGWSRRSAACSAARAPTRRPTATPASCSRPRDRQRL